MMHAPVFLLSPASCHGRRAEILIRAAAAFDLAVRLRRDGVSLGEAFSFLSGLYFRGKLAYARAFGRESWVIVPGKGLMPPEAIVRVRDLCDFAAVPVNEKEAKYRLPLERDVKWLAERLAKKDRVVLLGSIASRKYVDILVPPLGARLMFPSTFVGRGDMSRGGLMLRSAATGHELEYVPVDGAIRRGACPAKLKPLPRKGNAPPHVA